MSSTYYKPVDGIVKLEPVGDDDPALVHTVDGVTLVGSFILRHLHGAAAIQISFGGTVQGCVVTELLPGLGPDEYLIDEEGELFSVRELREIDGTGGYVA